MKEWLIELQAELDSAVWRMVKACRPGVRGRCAGGRVEAARALDGVSLAVRSPLRLAGAVGCAVRGLCWLTPMTV